MAKVDVKQVVHGVELAIEAVAAINSQSEHKHKDKVATVLDGAYKAIQVVKLFKFFK